MLTNPGMTTTFSGPPRVLVAVEQKMLRDLVALTLNHGTHEVRTALLVGDAVALIADWHPHFIVAEMGWSGEEILRAIGRPARTNRDRVPVMALTRRGNLRDKLEAFEQGADDILTVPFAPEELLARALVIIRRTYGVALPFQPVLRLGEIEIDILNRRVKAGSSDIHLTGLEQSLLYLLAARAGQVVTREEIADALWGTDYIAESNVVDRHVRNLRAKLQDDWRKPRFIATDSGKGYRFVPVFSDPDALH